MVIRTKVFKVVKVSEVGFDLININELIEDDVLIKNYKELLGKSVYLARGEIRAPDCEEEGVCCLYRIFGDELVLVAYPCTCDEIYWVRHLHDVWKAGLDWRALYDKLEGRGWRGNYK
jgi:pyruvate formate-lyase activating enzyme-like uncharacterized protein